MAGDFTLVRELGRGASSVVHLAWQRSLHREVALKRLHRTLSGDASASARLRREGQVISRLDHPHVVRLYDLIEDGPDLVLVMEYVRGHSVRALSLVSPPSRSQVLAVVADVSSALDFASMRGVVHRDVKPANVFITAAGRCKLGDFGLARIAGERWMFQSNDGSIRGTPLYMAPEQLRGGEPTSACDVYALSLMTLELLSRVHPFEGMTVRAAMEAHLDGVAAEVAAAAPLPAPLVAVLCAGLAPRADDRPTSRELARRLIEAAPRSWLEEDSSGGAQGPAPGGTEGVSVSLVAPPEGLWAAGDQGGWTMEVIDEATWLGASGSELDDPSAEPASGRAAYSSTQRAVAPHESARRPTIDDRWIRQPTPELMTGSSHRFMRPAVAVIAAFVVGFALALAAIELLHW